MTENDGVLFTRNNFDEHLEEDIVLLQEWYVCLDFFIYLTEGKRAAYL